jgi:glycosyltransferase involved in cell wall biosynthesis
MAAPRVTVITATMATFRPERRRGLDEVYRDLLAQTEQRFEWVIVTDGPEEALAADIAALGDSRIRLLGSPPSHHRYKAIGRHYGGYHQKALGVRAAAGDLICHVDDDNRIAPGYLKTLADTIESNQLDFAICAIKTDYRAAPVLRPKPPFPVYTSSGFDVLCMMIRRRFVEDVGGWPEYGGKNEPLGNRGDDEALLRIIITKGKYQIIDDVLGYHRTLPPAGRRHFVVSFPKAGRTWMRFLLGNYIRASFGLDVSDAQCLEVESLTTSRPGWPTIVVTHDRRCDELPVSKLVRNIDQFRGEAVTLLVRDPRDIVVSWYFERTRRYEKLWGKRADDSADLSAFIRSEYGIALVLRWMQDWGEQLDVPARVKWFRYEDFRTDPLHVARSVLEWLEVGNVDEGALSTAIAASSFDAMRALEASGASGSRRLTPGDPNDPESFKLRRGVVGGYRDYLQEQDIAYIEERMARDLPGCFGYKPCRSL